MDKLDPKTGRFTHFVSKPDEPDSSGPGLLTFLAETHDGNLWFVTVDELNMYDPRRQVFVHYEKRNEPGGLKVGYDSRTEYVLNDREIRTCSPVIGFVSAALTV